MAHIHDGMLLCQTKDEILSFSTAEMEPESVVLRHKQGMERQGGKGRFLGKDGLMNLRF